MRKRFFISLSLIVLTLAYWAYDSTASSLDTRYREVVEEILVDQVQLLASFIEKENYLNELESFERSIASAKAKSFYAIIYELKKQKMNLRIYLTDADGIVLYHSEDPSQVSKDYSDWRDVYLTLKGRYGARSTRDDELNDQSNVLWVAAPIKNQHDIIGVVSIGKSVSDWNTLMNSAVWSAQKGTLQFIIIGLLISLLLSFWIFNPLRKLKYLIEGESLTNLKIKGDEIDQVSNVYKSLKTDLEAKHYIENYVQLLTHELKSPLSAILGSVEILQSNPEHKIRDDFTKSIFSETKRIQTIVEMILKVSRLELEEDTETEEVYVVQLMDELVEILAQPLFETKVQLEHHRQKIFGVKLQVNRGLVIQALTNILMNSIQYSPDQGIIVIDYEIQPGNKLLVQIKDQGPGIPEYALDKIFQKFYSLKKPRSGKKGTGLGLSLVQEVMRLHSGEFSLRNHPRGGVEVVLTFKQ